jgi:hypothetical protein
LVEIEVAIAPSPGHMVARFFDFSSALPAELDSADSAGTHAEELARIGDGGMQDQLLE